MTIPTLAESARLTQDDFVAGIIETIITTNQMFDLMPFQGIDGITLTFNREATLGDTDYFEVGDEAGVAGKGGLAPTVTVQQSVSLTTLFGVADVNGLVAHAASNKNDQIQIQVQGKAKDAGRKYQNSMINGVNVAGEFAGLKSFLTAPQTLAAAGANGDAMTLELIDNLTTLVVDRDNEVDYITMNGKQINKFRALLRASNGAMISEVLELPSGGKAPSYGGVPILRNDYIANDETIGTSTNATSVYAGTFDDGSQKYGIAGLHSNNKMGISVEPVGRTKNKDEIGFHVVWYASMVNYSELGLAAATGLV